MRLLLLGILLGAPGIAHAQSAPAADPPSATVTGIKVMDGPVLAITAAGPLPAPRIGVLHDPERIYLDLAGVSSRGLRAEGDGNLVATVRVAQHSLDPLVARVVIDLTQPCRYSVDGSKRAAGRLALSLAPRTAPAAAQPGTSSAASQPGATPDAAATSTRSPRPARPRTAGAAPRYAARLQPVLQSLTVLSGVLRDIDKRMAPPADRMNAAQGELRRLRDVLQVLRPPRAFETAHDLLKSVVAFSSTALTLTESSTGPVPSNASSAAAGALLMLDRARAELQK